VDADEQLGRADHDGEDGRELVGDDARLGADRPLHDPLGDAEGEAEDVAVGRVEQVLAS
jgi:hypothetical protein